LGLAISKAYIEVLGGKIWVKVKKENTFYFFTQYIITPLEKREYRKSSHQGTNQIKELKILIAEDDF
jgi:signal transduction histidine kinase